MRPAALFVLPILGLAACTGDKEVVEDTGCALSRWYSDQDGDGYGDVASEALGCEPPDTAVILAGDCDDLDPAINPAATERCDSVDNDCDGHTDESAEDAQTVYQDADGDGFGDPGLSWTSCSLPAGSSLVASDCDDSDATVNTDAEERCDELDNDCDGLVDEDPVDPLTLYTDADADGFGDDAAVSTGCAAGLGQSEQSGDCDDADAGVNPAAVELPADGLDQDCDGEDACSTLRWWSGDLSLEGEDADVMARDFCASYNAIDGDLSFSSPTLRDLDDLSCLCSLSGDLEISESPLLSDLSGLGWLYEIGGDFNLSGPGEGCGALVSLSGLDGLTEVGGTFRINRVCYLDSLYGLGRLQEIGGDLYLNTLPLMDELSGVGALTTIGGSFKLKRMDSLRDLSGPSALTSADGLAISGGDRLLSLEGLESLTALTGDLVLSGTPSLQSMRGLDGLICVGGDLSLTDNDALLALDGLDSLRQVLGDVEISDNPLLTDLDALAGLEAVGGDLRITGNLSLTDDAGEALVESIGDENIDGRITVSGNGP